MKVKGGWCPRRVEGSLETGALLGQFKRSDVFTAELCPGMKGVQAEVMAALVSSVIHKKKKTPQEKKKFSSGSDSTSKEWIHGQWHRRAIRTRT